VIITGHRGALGTAGLTVEGVAELHAAGLDVTAWPVPDPNTLDQAVALAVDGITTDNPHLLQPVR
jgi:glycerophosphoryl diester phosphodiesterase